MCYYVIHSQYLSSGSLGHGQWVVPITLCYGSYNVRKTSLLHGKVGSVSLSGMAPSQKDSGDCSELSDQASSMQLQEAKLSWIKLNVGQTSFYRVQYDDKLAARLRSAIAAGLLDATDRFGVLDDTYALCSACNQPLSALLSLMDVYRRELDYTVLSCLIDIDYKVSRVVSDAIPTSAAHIKSFIIKLLQFATKKLGWEPISGESHLDAMLRGELLAALAVFGHEETKAEALRRFKVFLNDRSTPLLSADIRKAAYIAIMQKVTASNRSGYESLLRVFRETDLSQEKARILSTIASSPDPSIVREALDFSLSSEVRNQDVVYVLSGISKEGRATAWLWLKDLYDGAKENWDLIWKNWGSGVLISRFISAAASPFSSAETADEIEVFFSTRMQPSIKRTVNQSIEQIRINAQWVKHLQQEKGLADLLQELAYRKY
eukprot:Gb_22901 [translate_table: standard]